MKGYNCIIYDPNAKEFTTHDVMPFFLNIYKRSQEKPQGFQEFKNFVLKWGQYQYWARCEYEVILLDWPTERTKQKLDVYQQIKNNVDIITEILMFNIEHEENKKII
jgi:hypothetical protein